MGKTPPKLKLVGSDQEESSEGGFRVSDGFDFIAIDELTQNERKRLERLLSEVAPRAGVIAVVRTLRPWDVRPVVLLSGEEAPSVIRLAGPDVALSQPVSARVRETLDQLSRFSDCRSGLIEWGTFEGQLWYRRSLAPATLAHSLSGSVELDARRAAALIRRLADELHTWHAHGIIHGHVSTSNIVFDESGGIFLLDAAVCAASLQASREPIGDGMQSIAPEILTSSNVGYSADIYGFGQVIRRVFLALRKKYRFSDDRREAARLLEPYQQFTTAMVERDPIKRPQLSEVRAFLTSLDPHRQEAAGFQGPKRPPKSAGKLIQQPAPAPAPTPTMAQPASAAPRQSAAPSPHAEAPRPPASPRRPQRAPRPVKERPSAPPAAEPRTAIIPPPPAPAPHEQADNPFASEALFENQSWQPVPPPSDLDAEGIFRAPSEADADADPFPELFAADYPFEPAAPPPAEHYSGGPDVNTSIYRAMAGQKHVPEAAADAKLGFADAFREDLNSDPFTDPFNLEDDPFDLEADVRPLAGGGQPAPKPLLNTRPETRRAAAAPSSSPGGFGVFLLILGLTLAAVWYYLRVWQPGQSAIEYTYYELREDWTSLMPSRMAIVAELAVAADLDNREVQDLIVASAKNGDKLPSVVNVDLLRFAFNDKWEMELQPEDRRLAIGLALANLLREKMPQDFGPLEERHPGLILAVTASAGERVNKVLERIPAAVLTKLPVPYKLAFEKLIEGKENVTCADKGVQLLAQFSTRGVEKTQDIAQYLSTDVEARLQAIAMLLSHHDHLARGLLDVLLNHPNLVLDIPEIKWGRAWELMSWQELASADKLFVLAGIPPADPVDPGNLVKLFTHPHGTLRSFAIGQALDRVKFNHPGAFTVLDKVRLRPELLDSEQLPRLAALLEDPAGANEKRIQSWLALEPPVEIAADLLIATAGQKEALKFDSWLGFYLKSKNWEPNLEQMKQLVNHPDGYTRFFTYGEILRMKDEKTALSLLQSAYQREPNQEYRAQLEHMIGQLSE